MNAKLRVYMTRVHSFALILFWKRNSVHSTTIIITLSTTDTVGNSNIFICVQYSSGTDRGQGQQRKLSPISIWKNNYYTFKEHKQSCLDLRKFAPSKKFRNNKRLSPIFLLYKGNELTGFFSTFKYLPFFPSVSSFSFKFSLNSFLLMTMHSHSRVQRLIDWSS